MQKLIGKLIEKSIKKLQADGLWGDFEIPEIVVERPKDLSHGDWTTNISFVLAKELKKAPYDIANELSELLLEQNENEKISDIVAVEPGYINFVLDRKVLNNVLETVISEGDDFGKSDILKGKVVTVEYTQPNPFKPFHIGHLMSNAIGESVSKIIEFSGAQVVRANYQGDVGPQVAKAIWAIEKYDYDVNDIEQIGKAYAKGHEAFSNDEQVKKEIRAINKSVYYEDDEALMEIYKKGREKSLERFEEIYKILGTKFDQNYFESETWRMGEEIVRENVGNIFEESEGAIIFDGEKYGLHKRVFITAQGLTTYEAKEIGLAMLKKDRSPSDLYVMTTAVEQEEYFKVVKKAIELIDPYFEGRLKHVPHGMMQLTSGKMSSRSGNVVTGESLIENAQEVAAKKVSERVEGDATSELIDMIAVAGIKFNILKQRVSKNIAYDPDTAISFEGDSGPYLQYTYARCKSVIEKAKEQNIKSVTDGVVCDKSQDIEKLLAQFGEVVERSSNEYASHHVANYILELAHEYNAYYAENIIIDTKNSELSAYRVAVTVATAQVIKNALMLLGIRVPEQM